MDESNLVTIIVPVYNVEKYIGRCLDSILLQDYTHIEILCIDDCSPDNSASIIHDYEKNMRMCTITLMKKMADWDMREIMVFPRQKESIYYL